MYYGIITEEDYSPETSELLQLIRWSNEEFEKGNRIKASKIKRAAEKMSVLQKQERPWRYDVY